VTPTNFIKIGKTEKAQECWNKVLSIDPNNQFAIRSLKYIKNELICAKCRSKYPVKDGIPVLMVK